jgi:hypothetical protein
VQEVLETVIESGDMLETGVGLEIGSMSENGNVGDKFGVEDVLVRGLAGLEGDEVVVEVDLTSEREDDDRDHDLLGLGGTLVDSDFVDGLRAVTVLTVLIV